MDALAIILRTVRETIQSTGAPPDALQDALADAERRLRSVLGGGLHPISRVPSEPIKARILALAETGLAPAIIAQRLGITDRYVRRVIADGTAVQRIPKRLRIIELACAGHDSQAIAQQLATDPGYVAEVLAEARAG